jgi:hypothetical protein
VDYDGVEEGLGGDGGLYSSQSDNGRKQCSFSRRVRRSERKAGDEAEKYASLTFSSSDAYWTDLPTPFHLCGSPPPRQLTPSNAYEINDRFLPHSFVVVSLRCALRATRLLVVPLFSPATIQPLKSVSDCRRSTPSFSPPSSFPPPRLNPDECA